jgi:integrase
MATMRYRYVHEYTDRTGAIRRYFRRKCVKSVALKGAPGSREFREAYEAALSGQTELPRGGGHGSLAELVTNWKRSPGFVNLKPRSKKAYNSALRPILEKHGHRLVKDLPGDKAEKIIADIGVDRPGMANLTKKVLRKIFAYAVRKRIRRDNPFDAIEAYKLGKHHTWTDDELTKFEGCWPLGTRERLAYALLLYTGQRVGDVAAMTRDDVKSGSIRVVQEKVSDDGDDETEELWIALHPALVRAMQAGPAHVSRLISNRWGKALNGETLGKLVAKAVKKAGLPKRCVPHGLRKAAIRRLAEHGSTTKEIQSVSGHKTLGMIEKYTERASRARLSKSAIGKLPKSG